MHNITLTPQPLTTESFSPFGEVIQKSAATRLDINEGRFARYLNLATVDSQDNDGYTNVSIFSCNNPSSLPYTISMLERHSLGSQAFMPLATFKFIVVVAPPDEHPKIERLRAFITNGSQGINLHRGVWHLPLIGLEKGQEFIVIDRGGEKNCDEYVLPKPVSLVWEEA